LGERVAELLNESLNKRLSIDSGVFNNSVLFVLTHTVQLLSGVFNNSVLFVLIQQLSIVRIDSYGTVTFLPRDGLYIFVLLTGEVRTVHVFSWHFGPKDVFDSILTLWAVSTCMYLVCAPV
jgi:hypothetical protein